MNKIAKAIKEHYRHETIKRITVLLLEEIQYNKDNESKITKEFKLLTKVI